jgi:GntP family gluconate:H+ symporter
MDPITPVHSTGVLLLIAAAAVAVLLVLIMRLKLHAFVSLVLVSTVTAVVAGIPVADVPTALLTGFAGTIGAVALLVGFGVMLGRLLEVTGGAQVLADTLITRFGERRAPFALGVAALLFGFPIFFDAGLVVFLPIIFTVARRFGGSLLLYAFPAAGAFAAMHAIVPPHPGPVAATVALEGDVGMSLLVGVPVAVVAWYVGSYLYSQYIGRRVQVTVPDLLFGQENGGAPAEDAPRPAFVLVLGLLLLPMLLISLNTVLTTLVDSGAIEAGTAVDTLRLLGNTPIALLLTLLAAIALLGPRVGTVAQVSSILDEALGPVCSIILITGAGGMFGGVLRTSGIGTALTDSLGELGLPVLLQAFVVATLLRVAQGSATVALTTTAGLIAPLVASEQLDDFRITLVVVAIAAGATVLSHVNDSGFWLVSRFFGMDEKRTLRTWTVMETTLGLSAFVLAAALWGVAGAVGA